MGDQSGDSPVHVLIIGAGITGLLVAQALKEAGITYSIFESEPSASHYRPREWGMSIHWGKPLLKQLLPEEMWSRIVEPQVDPFHPSGSSDDGYSVSFYNGATGEHLIDQPMTNAIRVSRRKMRAFCAQGIDIQYGKAIDTISTTDKAVTATFKDGSTVTGSILVGTDGARSKVREILFSDPSTPDSNAGAIQPVGVKLYNINARFPDSAAPLALRKINPMASVALHPAKNLSLWTSIQEVPDKDDTTSWQFQLMPSWPSSPDDPVLTTSAERLAHLKAKILGPEGGEVSQPWKIAYENIPADTEVAENAVNYWVTVPWDSRGGRVTIAGDAAHPLPPHRGQGLNHCIADVVNFVDAVKKSSAGDVGLQEAMDKYRDEVVERGGKEVIVSKMSAIMVHDYDKFMEAPVMKRGYTKGS